LSAVQQVCVQKKEIKKMAIDTAILASRTVACSQSARTNKKATAETVRKTKSR
jgi:hypothetical protein